MKKKQLFIDNSGKTISSIESQPQENTKNYSVKTVKVYKTNRRWQIGWSSEKAKTVSQRFSFFWNTKHKILRGYKLLTIFKKRSILDDWQGSEYTMSVPRLS